jgi:hypothetical protein
MAIHVQIQKASLSNEGLNLLIHTPNDDFPGETIRSACTSATTFIAPPFKAQIDAEVTLLFDGNG